MERFKLRELFLLLIFVQIFTIIGVCFVNSDEITGYIYDSSINGVVRGVRSSEIFDKNDEYGLKRHKVYDYCIDYTVDDVDYCVWVRSSEIKHRDGDSVMVSYMSDDPAQSVMKFSDESTDRIGKVIIYSSIGVSVFILIAIVEIMVCRIRIYNRRRKRKRSN